LEFNLVDAISEKKEGQEETNNNSDQ